MIDKHIEYHDAGPDERGRRSFTLHWLVESTANPRAPVVELDGRTLYVRAQCFRVDPAKYAEGAKEGVPAWAS